jgi:hypothetical protein
MTWMVMMRVTATRAVLPWRRIRGKEEEDEEEDEEEEEEKLYDN